MAEMTEVLRDRYDSILVHFLYTTQAVYVVLRGIWRFVYRGGCVPKNACSKGENSTFDFSFWAGMMYRRRHSPYVLLSQHQQVSTCYRQRSAV